MVFLIVILLVTLLAGYPLYIVSSIFSIFRGTIKFGGSNLFSKSYLAFR
jgi:hypothetical protein